jgi:Cysteine-rich CPCC
MAYRCPCCYPRTLKGEPFEICPVCFWKDGTMEPDSESMIQARQNYLEFGASSREVLAYVRPPLPEELYWGVENELHNPRSTVRHD